MALTNDPRSVDMALCSQDRKTDSFPLDADLPRVIHELSTKTL